MVVTLDSETRTADSPEAGSADTPPAAQAAKPPAKRRKSRRGWSMRLLRKIWLPLIIIIVVAIAAFGVYRLHGIFGKTETTRQGSGLANDTKPFNPKTVVYEIYGPPGTVATINYLDLNATPQIARDVTLPWSLTLTTTAPAASANIVAQGDSDTIGCRITVNGELKDEKTSTGVNAQTFCLVKSA
jgi:flagellar basal body-associated protein FliL